MGLTETASRIIARYGQPALIECEGGEPVNPWDDPSTTITFYDCTVSVGKYDQAYTDGTLIQESDRRVFLSLEGLEIEPTLSDRLAIGDDTFSIAAIHPLAPDGEVRFYEIQARL